MTHQYTTRVEFEDVDMDGFVHHHRIACYLERAVVHCYRDDLSVPIKTEDYIIVLARLDLSCRAPIRFDDTVTVKLSGQNIGAATMTWNAVLTTSSTNQVKASATITHACICARTLRPQRWPDALRTILENELQR
jgi:YbgC/YbaW family acyl-CoA thioester hydrolase